jgi:hypothetical protein
MSKAEEQRWVAVMLDKLAVQGMVAAARLPHLPGACDE